MPTAPNGVVLVVTEADDPHADLVIAELNRRGRVEVVRVDPGDFPHTVRLAATLDTIAGGWDGTLITPSREIELNDVTSVYWRRPSGYRFPGLGERDAAFATAQAVAGFGGVLTALPGAAYVNRPDRNRRAESKPAQLALAAELGFRVPPTLITSDPGSAREFIAKHAPVVFKPLQVTEVRRGDRPAVLWTQRVEVDELYGSVAGTAHQFQAEVAAKTSDLRVTVVGERVFCVRITSGPPDGPGLLDWRCDYDALSYELIDPPAEMAARLKGYLDELELAFGCFDFAVDPDGEPWFLECNPNGQWVWMEEPTGAPMTAAFADLLEGTS
ncbi:ATP-grasp ribosomal peptide maturase [Kribbella sp. NPDC023972]|uniref:ATP-grasp ribosomal peptide maturase n=1 Tax=Kribbella sp. NPDC023972 TaxID=3154795 RepID=UPI0033F52708